MTFSKRAPHLNALAPSRPFKTTQEDAEALPFFLAGLCHPVVGVKKLTAKTLVAIGRGEQRADGRSDRCLSILSPPVLPALVAILGDGDTGAAQVSCRVSRVRAGLRQKYSFSSGATVEEGVKYLTSAGSQIS